MRNKKLILFFLLLMLLIIPSGGLLAQGTKQEKFRASGTIVDETGIPLIGVTIAIKDNLQKGTISDADGRFSIETSPNATLMFSYIGYTSKALPAKDMKDARIELEQIVGLMDEIVVVGYGTVRKQDLTGAVSVVKTADLTNIPTSRVDQMLQGRIAGVDVISTGGQPGANTSIRIRGTRSITASNDPLYVIDGVVDASTSIGDINPSDIESIEVLKDASATAIYGSRAANGVILITTKLGEEGKAKFTFKADMGFSQLPKRLDVMNATEYALYYNDYKSIPADIIGSTSPNGAPTNYLEQLTYSDPLSFGKGTNWVEEVTRTSPYQSYLLSGSGGGRAMRYYFSVSHINNEGIINNSGLKRTQARINLTQDIAKGIKFGARLNYTNSKTENNTIELGTIRTANVNGAISLTPLMEVYKEDGSYNDWNPIMGGKGGYIDSPVALANLAQDNAFVKSLSTSFFLEVTLLKDLVLKTTLGYSDYNRRIEKLLPSTLPTRVMKEQGAYAYQQSSSAIDILNENTANYKKKIGKHSFDLLYGFTYQKRVNEMLEGGGNGYTNDNSALWSLGGIPDKQNLTLGSNTTERLTLSNLGRINYNYDNRYYLTTTFRADGASNFAKNNKWAYFPSVALKWNIMNEAFMKKTEKYLSGTAIRLSYGIIGNQGIAPYASLAKMTPFATGYIFNDVIPGSFYQSSIGSPNLTWEKTTSYNFGFDFGVLRNRVTFSFDYYDAETKDLLLNVQIPNHTGYSTRLENIGRTWNKGYEFAINSVNIDTRKFNWSTTLTISHNKQMVKDAGGYDRIPTYTPNSYTYEMYGYKQGYPVNALWGMEYAGTWKSKTEIEENKTSKKYVSKTLAFTDVGRQKYVDQNNDGQLDRNDIVYLGSTDPIIYGGIQNRFTFHGVSLNIYFNYSLGGYIFNPLELSMGSGDYQTNQYRYMTNSWHPVRNPDSDIPRPNSKDFVVSSVQRHKASFLRLKDVSLGYTFYLARKTNNKISKLTLTASGSNLYLWKYYNGFDPEVSSPNETRRVDLGSYPSARTIIFGVQVDF